MTEEQDLQVQKGIHVKLAPPDEQKQKQKDLLVKLMAKVSNPLTVPSSNARHGATQWYGIHNLGSNDPLDDDYMCPHDRLDLIHAIMKKEKEESNHD